MQKKILASRNSVSDADNRGGGKEIPRLLRKAQLHYSANKNPTRLPLPSQFNAVQTVTLHLFKIHFKINLLFMPESRSERTGNTSDVRKLSAHIQNTEQ